MKFLTVTVYVQLRVTTNLWKMKATLSTAVLLLAISPFAFAQSDLERAQQEFITLRKQLGTNKISDILFLLDTSGSVSNYAFEVEKKFVINFLSTITVSFEEARVAVIPFGNTGSLYIDGVSNPSSDKDKCDLIQKLKQMPHSYAWATNTKSAFQLAFDVCLGKYSANKRGPFHKVRTVVILITDGYWNWPYNDPSPPIPIAQSLLAANVEVFAIGVAYANLNLPALQQLVKDPAKQAFLLNDFGELRHLSFLVRGGK